MKALILTFFAMVKTSFGRFKVADLLAKADVIYKAMLTNTDFPDPEPDLPTLLALIANLRAAQVVVENGDLSGIATRDQAKRELVEALKSIGNYNNFTARGSAVLLSKTGYDLYKSGQTIVLQAIKSIVAMSIPNTNSVSVRVAGGKGAKSFMFQYSIDAEKSETSWVSINNTTRKYTIQNLTKGTEVFLRVIAIGSHGQQVVSETISRYVQ